MLITSSEVSAGYCIVHDAAVYLSMKWHHHGTILHRVHIKIPFVF